MRGRTHKQGGHENKKSKQMKQKQNREAGPKQREEGLCDKIGQQQQTDMTMAQHKFIQVREPACVWEGGCPVNIITV